MDVLKLVAENNVVLGTCHLSPGEIFALVKAARDIGVKKIQITHPFFKVPRLSLEQLKELVALGASAEFGYCTVSPMWNYATIDEVVAAIKAVGADHAVLMSDAGQRHNPMPHEALRVFAQSLYEKGLTEEEIRRMVVVKPAELLGLEAR
jgi:sugar phosphate isomerase/epimerase